MRTITLKLTPEQYNNLKILSIIEGVAVGDMILSLIKESKEWKQFEFKDACLSGFNNQ